MEKLMGFWVVIFVGLVLSKWDVKSFDLDELHNKNGTDASFLESMSYLESMYGVSAAAPPADALIVGLTLIEGASAKGAVCLDGTLPGYHLHGGFGTGANSWLIQLEGGGWCNTIRSCVFRKTTRRGSSKFFEKSLPFTGILSNKAEENPDFFNWNRVKLRYCDGASFAGEGEDKAAGLQFRGQRIWEAGLNTDVSGGHTLRNFFGGVVSLQGVKSKLPSTCTNRLDPTSCFFPQNLIANIKTPLFILNAAYDSWQVQQSLAPPSADPHGTWHDCKADNEKCSAPQIQFLQDFRDTMLNAVKGLEASEQSGIFLNSCFAHCQSERQDTWFADDSPEIGKKTVAMAVGDWYFDRSTVKAIDCAYPCDKTCHNLVFQ